MGFNKPECPPDWVLERIAKNWIIVPEEGLVLSRTKNMEPIGSIAADGYTVVDVSGFRPIRRSHVIWYGKHNKWPEQELDHDDRTKTNDKISNLKLSTSSGNNRNKDSVQARDLPVGIYRTKPPKQVAGYNVIRWINSKNVNLKWFNASRFEEALRLNQIASEAIALGTASKESILQTFYQERTTYDK